MKKSYVVKVWLAVLTSMITLIVTTTLVHGRISSFTDYPEERTAEPCACCIKERIPEERQPGGRYTGESYINRVVPITVYHDCHSINPSAERIAPPSFVDPITGIEWVAIDSRLCEHSKWGLDILYTPVDTGSDIEAKWICRGSWTMDEYIQINNCCDVADKFCGNLSENDVITPFNARICGKTGCYGEVVIVESFGWAVRVDQRFCVHLPWGVDILYEEGIIRVQVCNSCNHGHTSTWIHRSWRCYGFVH